MHTKTTTAVIMALLNTAAAADCPLPYVKPSWCPSPPAATVDFASRTRGTCECIGGSGNCKVFFDDKCTNPHSRYAANFTQRKFISEAKEKEFNDLVKASKIRRDGVNSDNKVAMSTWL